jgi:pyridinium-3,5-bisthiocarboxylic acid mononucleotide nickel chelatase
MKTAYFDVQFGAAGDMLVASLISAGLDEKRWTEEVRKIALPVSSYQLRISDVMRCSIKCKKLDVLNEAGEQLDLYYGMEIDPNSHHHHFHGHDDVGHEHTHLHTHSHSHTHTHSHVHSHGPGDEHVHEHEHEHEHTHHHHHHDHEHEHPHDNGHTHEHEHSHSHGTRTLKEVISIIDASPIAIEAKQLAERIFRRLAASEGKVHGVPAEDVHFHEVGSVDAIIDIVGFAIGYHMLGIQRSTVSAVPLGKGKVKTEHGLFPAPGPAVVYLLADAGAKTIDSSINFECLTPTGAAILCEIADAWDSQPSFSQVQSAGYGAGTKDPSGWPNVVRVVIGEAPETQSGSGKYDCDTVAVVEANLDDFSPQALSYAIDRLFEAGAFDVTVIAAVMKKGRSGHVLTVLCAPSDRLKIQETIIAETSSIGTRWHLAQRVITKRDWKQVKLAKGTVRVKIAMDKDGAPVNVQPEFDDCAAYAQEHGLPVKEVLTQALVAFRQQHGS